MNIAAFQLGIDQKEGTKEINPLNLELCQKQIPCFLKIKEEEEEKEKEKEKKDIVQ